MGSVVEEFFAKLYIQTGIQELCRIYVRTLSAASGSNIDLRCIHDKTELQFQT